VTIVVDRTQLPEIFCAISQYAKSYAALESFQGDALPLPRGDQKAGCIAEFYALLYLQATFRDAEVMRAGHSNKAWDFEVSHREGTVRIQVKAVSAFARGRRLSPIHFGWDHLLVFYLDQSLLPVGFWVVSDNSMLERGQCLQGLQCPSPDGRYRGSNLLPFGDNRIEKWHEARTRFGC
jgi:hypothetical protein